MDSCSDVYRSTSDEKSIEYLRNVTYYSTCHTTGLFLSR